MYDALLVTQRNNITILHLQGIMLTLLNALVKQISMLTFVNKHNSIKIVSRYLFTNVTLLVVQEDNSKGFPKPLQEIYNALRKTTTN